jgi:hypothetical protein
LAEGGSNAVVVIVCPGAGSSSPSNATVVVCYFFSALCELVHIRPTESKASWGLPDGVSRFQYPGLARSLAVYCVNGLVFYPLSRPRDGQTASPPLRLACW